MGFEDGGFLPRWKESSSKTRVGFFEESPIFEEPLSSNNFFIFDPRSRKSKTPFPSSIFGAEERKIHPSLIFDTYRLRISKNLDLRFSGSKNGSTIGWKTGGVCANSSMMGGGSSKTCRIQNPDTPRAGRVGAAHSRATGQRWAE